MGKASNNNKKGNKRRGLLRILLFSAVIFIFIVFVVGVATVAYLVHDVEKASLSDIKVNETSFVLDANGEIITQLHSVQNRVTVPIDTMPDFLIKGVVVMEDVRFYDHFGFSPRDFLRGFLLTVTGRDRQGASTITQQVARNRILKNLDFSIKRKVQEIYLAFLMEKEYSKKEILEAYLNELFLGGSAHGMQAAAQQYFGKDVSVLNLAESAMLVGLIPSPNAYRPTNNFEVSKGRQALVLNQMLKHNLITEVERQDALDYKITLATARTTTVNGDLTNFFIDHVIREVENILMKKHEVSRGVASNMIYGGGYTIHTTLDLKMQKAAERAAIDIITQPDGINARVRAAALIDDDPAVKTAAKNTDFVWLHPDKARLQPQVSMLIIEPSTGYIKVWLGGRDMVARQGLDRVASITNQPGSAIKPLVVYGPALASGRFTAASTIDDVPSAWGNYIPRNYTPNTFYGYTSIRNGIPPSHNVMAVRLLEQVGVRNAIEWAEKLGIGTFVKSGSANDIGLASGLGGLTDGVTLVDMVKAYNVFNNRGVLVEPSAVLKITTREGSTVYQAPGPKQEIVISEPLAWLMTDIMRAVVNPGGSGIQLRSVGRYQGDAAGKTGTTNSNVDAMFLGYTPAYTGGVWIGHDDSLTGTIQRDGSGNRILRDPNQPSTATNWLRGGLPSNVGSGFATAIFGRTLSYYTENKSLPSFDATPPERLGMVKTIVCKVSGKLSSPVCPVQDLREEWFIPGTEPKEMCNLHIIIKICTEHNQLATELCPPHTVVEQIRIKREPYFELFDRSGNQLHPQDAARQVPFQTCTVHRPTVPDGSNDGGTGGPGGQ
ncbi:MAG: penicillin-binding protein 1A [Bacillota bacterium]|nr:MAG: penicillin-binding protein 1A [Bacillota bacterium]MBS3949050.1 transglycosylase domain-containing protein [Peptococcaceae bacterium]